MTKFYSSAIFTSRVMGLQIRLIGKAIKTPFRRSGHNYHYASNKLSYCIHSCVCMAIYIYIFIGQS